jgi:hypothetical protein
MNHKDIKMTLRYAKLSPDSGREAILNLGLWFFSQKLLKIIIYIWYRQAY